MVHYYRWNKAAEKQEIKAIVKLLHEDNEHIVKWAVTALANLCWNSESNRALIRDSNCIPKLMTLLQPTENELASSHSVASYAAYVFGGIAKDSTLNRGHVTTCEAIRRLVALMLDGNDEEKGNAVRALVTVSSNTNNCEGIVEAGAVDVLVRLMQNGSIRQQQNAASVLANLASVPKYESVVVAAGAIPMFVRMLQSNDSDGTVRAAMAITNLTANASIRYVIGHAGAIPPLVHLVKYGTDEEKIQAAAALIDLAVEPNLRSQISKENCIPSLVELVRNGTVLQQERAAHLLQNLALSGPDEVKIGEAGAIGPLLRMVENGNDGQKEKAAAALINLSHNAENKRVITKPGGVPRLVKLLLDGNRVHKEYAMATLWNLATMDKVEILEQIVNASTIPLLAQLTQRGSTARQREEAAKIMRLFSVACLKHHAVKMDVIPALVTLVGGQSSPARASAAAALANLAFQHISACVPVIVQSDGVHGLVKLLRDGNPGRERENGIAALVNLSNRAEAKTAIADADGLAALHVVGLSQVGTEREQDLAQRALSNIFADAKYVVMVFQHDYSILQVVQGELRPVH